MSEHSAVVAEYIAFNKFDPFEPVKLGGTICNPDNFDGSTQGNLTTIVWYLTPYFDPSGGNPIIFSFALSHDITINTIFGLPML
jgi:hypothetical protein